MAMTKHYNKTQLKEKRRKLKQTQTIVETNIWSQLRNRGLLGLKFKRQYSIDNYIVDFYCKDLSLAIEIDGESHYGNSAKDIKRDRRLNELGVNLLRFDDLEVRHHTDLVLKKIEEWIKQNKK